MGVAFGHRFLSCGLSNSVFQSSNVQVLLFEVYIWLVFCVSSFHSRQKHQQWRLNCSWRCYSPVFLPWFPPLKHRWQTRPHLWKNTLTVILLTKLTLTSSTFHVFRPIHRLVQMGILAFPEAPVYQVPTVATERRGSKESVEQKEGRVRLVPRPLQIGSNVFGRKVMTETTDCYR